MATFSVVTTCADQEAQVVAFHAAVRDVFANDLPGHDFELIFLDCRSKDGTVARLRELALEDPRVRVIVTARNFGAIRTPYYGLLQSEGDATIAIAIDEAPALLGDLVRRWEAGAKIVAGVRAPDRESRLARLLGSLFRRMMRQLEHVEALEHFTGLALYDQRFVDVLRSIDDPYPYLPGLISELGYDIERVELPASTEPTGRTKANLYVLYDRAMMGITAHSRGPMRFASMAGFFLSAFSAAVGVAYLVAKLVFWSKFQLGLAPVVIGTFFLSSGILFVIGVLGEYVAGVQQHVRKLPLVIERERVNFAPGQEASLARPAAPPPRARPVARAPADVPPGN